MVCYGATGVTGGPKNPRTEATLAGKIIQMGGDFCTFFPFQSFKGRTKWVADFSLVNYDIFQADLVFATYAYMHICIIYMYIYSYITYIYIHMYMGHMGNNSGFCQALGWPDASLALVSAGSFPKNSDKLEDI